MSNNMRFFLLIVYTVLLAACAVKQQSDADLLLKSTIKQRSILQFRYAQLSDEFWQRTGTLFKENSQLPMRSKQLVTLQKINQNLQFNIDQLTTKLATLDTKIDSIKKSKITGKMVKISLVKGTWKHAQKVTQIAQDELNIVAGEKLTWPLLQQNQITLPNIEITLSEKGHLYIDGQKAASISLQTPSSIELNDVSVFAQQPFAIGKINMSLIIQLIN